MFTLKEEWGNHKIYKYDNSKYNFISFFQNLYNETKLENLHIKSNDFILSEVNNSTNTKIGNCNVVEMEHSIYNHNIYKLEHIACCRDDIKHSTNEMFSLQFNEGNYILLLSKVTFKDNTIKDYIIFFIDNFEFEINDISDVKYIISCFNFNKLRY